MAEKEKKSNLFKLDGNVDGTYVDTDGNVIPIENMIQAVGATDGPAAYPTNTSRFAKFSEDDLLDLENNSINVQQNVNISGHGIIYDESGNPIAHSGDIVLRDGKNNFTTLNGLLDKVNTIFVDTDGKNYLRDVSLQSYNTNDMGVNLDDLIAKTVDDSGMYGTGNVVQLASNYNVNESSVSIYTVELSENNNVFVVANASISGQATLQLRDTTANIVLDYSYVKAESDKSIPVYLSYTGPLPEISSEVTESTCNKYVWSSFLKRFFSFKNTESLFRSHQIALEVLEGNPYYRGTLNIICHDDGIGTETITSGNEILSDAETCQIVFETEMPAETYSITLQLENSISSWYTDKTINGFTVNFENRYTGNLIWSAIYVAS